MSRRRYPLETLVRLRAHRTELARQALLEKQRATRASRERCLRIEGEVDTLARERGRQRSQLLAPPPPGLDWPSALAQRERHIEYLAELAEAARGRLQQARAALAQAEQEQDAARQAWFRTRARQEALEQRRDLWRREQRRAEARRDETAAEDLVSARHRPLVPS